MKRRRTVSVCVQHFDFYKLPKSNLMKANYPVSCSVRFWSEQINAVTEHIQLDRTNENK